MLNTIYNIVKTELFGGNIWILLKKTLIVQEKQQICKFTKKKTVLKINHYIFTVNHFI